MAFLGFPSVSVCVHNDRSNTSAAAELAEFRRITAFYGKTKYLMNTLYTKLRLSDSLANINSHSKLNVTQSPRRL